MAFGIFDVLLLFLVLDVLWWRAADRRLRVLGEFRRWRRISIAARIALAVFVMGMVTYVISSRLVLRKLGSSEGPVPIGVHAFVYIWHFLILPMAMIWLLIGAVGRRVVQLTRRGKARGAGTALPADSIPAPQPSARDSATSKLPSTRIAPSRRQIIAAAGMAIPPLAAAATVGYRFQPIPDISIDWGSGTIRTNYGWRLRHFDVSIPQLPPALDGMTIAHISDTHIGKFLHHDRLPAIAQAVNQLGADFVVFTGDLIDLTLADLQFGIDFLRSIKPRCGMAVCEGNHDISEGDEAFEHRMRDAEIGFILADESTKTYVSRDGRCYPVQFLAIPWVPSSEERLLAVRELSPITSPDAFPILLAHHPHAFDPAAAAGLPLVLSGHTHGGQIMFTEHTGFGNTRFKYISGQYTKSKPGSNKPACNLIVNNGLGNWFPLRINAPAEIVHITLKS